MSALGDLTDPNDPLVIDACTRKCRICHTKAGNGNYCKSIITGRPLEGRLVHYERLGER